MVHRSSVAAVGDLRSHSEPRPRRPRAKRKLKLVHNDPDDDPEPPDRRGGAASRLAFDQGSRLDALAVAAQRGDRAAAEQLFRCVVADLYPLLRTVAERILRDATTAEDCAQDALMSAYGRLATFDPATGVFRSWIISIACHAAIKQRDAKTRRPTRSFDELCHDGDGVAASRELSPLDELIRKEGKRLDRERLDRHQERLSPVLRTAFVARWAGLTCRQYAEAEGLALDTARSRMFRSLCA